MGLLSKVLERRISVCKRLVSLDQMVVTWTCTFQKPSGSSHGWVKVGVPVLDHLLGVT